MIKSDFLRRLRALTIKEWCQLVRDPSSFAVGLVLPLVLIFIFGSGLSLDLGNTPIAVINQAPGNVSYAIEQGFKGSPYLTPINCGNIKEAEGLMRKKTVKGIVVIPSNFAGQFQAGKGKLQLIVHGVDTVSASSLERYIQQSVQISLGKLGYSSGKGAVPVVRLWFNAANSSTWYFVPGLVVVVITIVGAFLTALVIAREWERGTMEMLFSTPVKPSEILLSKVIPYFIVGMGGLFLCLFADGRFSGASRGASIGHVSPEAAVGGPIALVEEGDIIKINIPENTLMVDVSDEEMEKRRKNWQPREPKVTSGYLRRYANMVTSGSTGAILK